MLNSVFDVLMLRRPKLDYVSPPFCDFVFSGSSEAVIVTTPFEFCRPTNLRQISCIPTNFTTVQESLCIPTNIQVNPA
jgi:hypothetical protein